MLFAPLEGWRHVEVTDRHPALDYAQVLKDLSDRHFRSASKIVLVQDNLSTHKPASLYEAFPPAEARRLVERFEWHYTPKHGSWLDMAESELSVLSRQCLDRRIPDKPTLIEEVITWQDNRNKNHAKADWQFTTADARIKLKRLYQQCERLRALVASVWLRCARQCEDPCPVSARASPQLKTSRGASPCLCMSRSSARWPDELPHSLGGDCSRVPAGWIRNG